MDPVIFKKPHTFLNRIEILFWQLWDKPFIRFLFVGGVNTVLGYLTTLLLRFTLFIDQPKWILIETLIEFDAANTVMFILLFPVSYSLQAWFAFRTQWTWKRLLLYPLTSIPNYLLQQACILVFEDWLGIQPVVAYALSAILPIPIMFFVVRFLVTNPKTTSLK
ncbi:MAG: GtrA family protein [Firmicutes bacterium]|nr:GtrA family protein [Bacillota bacterium]